MNQVPMWSRIMVALCCVYRGALGQRQTVVDPVSGVTFSLYGGEVDWTWESAYNHCVSVGQRLAVIDDSSKQDAVNNFTESGHAWIGGRRSPDVTWRWISGEEYEYDDYDDYLFNNTRTRCVTVGKGPLSLVPGECVVLGGGIPAVCQQTARGASKRYWVTDTTSVSWNEARVSCLDQGGNLAHPSSQEPIQGWKQQMVDLIADPLYQAWIGLSRHSWSWVTGDHTTLQAYRSMTYTHFARGEGDDTNQNCVHLDNKRNNDNSWADKPCDFPSRYFVCDDGPPLTTTPQPGPARPTETPPGVDYPHQTEGGLTTAGTTDPATVHRGALGQRQTVVDPVSGVTFSLYGGEVEWTWERAYNHCVSVGQRLAVIDNSPKQEAVNRFTDIGHAWIGGRRSPDVTWRWISGEEYEYDDGDGYLFTNRGTRCGVVDTGTPSLHPNECVLEGPLPAVCQQRAQGASKRYWVTDTAFVSWNDARVSCLDQGGDLAHPSSQEPIQGWKQQMVDLIADPLRQAWIGLSRHSWSWVTGDHTTLQAYRSMTYTNFSRGEGDETNQTCAHLDMKGNNDNSWADKPSDFRSPYFVCDDGPPLTEKPPGADNTHQTEGDLSTTEIALKTTNMTQKWAAVGGGTGAGVVVLTVIVVVVICVRKRRMSRAPKGRAEDDDVDLEINTINDVTRQERVTGTGAHGDVIKPLTVAAGKETAYSSIPALKPAPKPAPKPATKPATKALKIPRKVTSRNKNPTVGPGDVYALPVTRKDERRQSDNLDMTENSEYGNLDLL